MKGSLLVSIERFRAGWALLAMMSLVFFLGTSPLLAQDEFEDDDEDMIVIVEDDEEMEDEIEEPTDEVDDVIEIEVEVEVEEEPEPEPTATLVPSPTPKPTEVPNQSMRDIYEKGIQLYKLKKYEEALEVLTRACTVQGAPAWLYGEAHAMRGVILHFYTKTSDHRAQALVAYRYSLDWDPKNKAANKHINQVD